MGKLPLLEVEIGDYGDAEEAMVRYRRDGEARAAALGNRGPIRFTADGALDPAIIEAYDRTGFYIFEGVLERRGAGGHRARRHRMLDNAPVTKGAAARPPRSSGARRRRARPQPRLGQAAVRSGRRARAPSTAGTRPR